MTKYIGIPTEIEAVHFKSGESLNDLVSFMGDDGYEYLDLAFFPGSVKVYDKLHDSWITLKLGDWIIRGTKGEYYPCDNEVFIQKYEEVK